MKILPGGRILGATVEGLDLSQGENFGTIHNAIADYGPHEHRLIRRCQVMATRFFQEERA